jgi:hypothetical protein
MGHARTNKSAPTWNTVNPKTDDVWQSLVPAEKK